METACVDGHSRLSVVIDPGGHWMGSLALSRPCRFGGKYFAAGSYSDNVIYHEVL